LIATIGLIAMLVGTLDPLEGSIFILGGAAVVAAGAWAFKSRFRKIIYLAFALVALGVGAMFALSVVGGIGGNSGRSMWWGLLILPYPLGWLLGLFGAVRMLAERRSPAIPSDAQKDA
jgi:hypothetical protein